MWKNLFKLNLLQKSLLRIITDKFQRRIITYWFPQDAFILISWRNEIEFLKEIHVIDFNLFMHNDIENGNHNSQRNLHYEHLEFHWWFAWEALNAEIKRSNSWECKFKKMFHLRILNRINSLSELIKWFEFTAFFSAGTLKLNLMSCFFDNINVLVVYSWL